MVSLANMQFNRYNLLKFPPKINEGSDIWGLITETLANYGAHVFGRGLITLPCLGLITRV